MRLLAIDPGSNKCGIAFYENGILKNLETFISIAKTPLERRLVIATLLFNAVKSSDAVICEEPFLQGRANTGMQRLLGMIEFMAGRTIQMIHPMTVKKLIAPGFKEKIDVALAAGKLLKTAKEKELLASAISREAFDETDAAAIGLTYLMKERA